MNARAVANEFAKMRHLKVGLIAVVMVLGLSLFAVVSSRNGKYTSVCTGILPRAALRRPCWSRGPQQPDRRS